MYSSRATIVISFTWYFLPMRVCNYRKVINLKNTLPGATAHVDISILKM